MLSCPCHVRGWALPCDVGQEHPVGLEGTRNQSGASPALSQGIPNLRAQVAPQLQYEQSSKTSPQDAEAAPRPHTEQDQAVAVPCGAAWPWHPLASQDNTAKISPAGSHEQAPGCKSFSVVSDQPEASFLLSRRNPKRCPWVTCPSQRKLRAGAGRVQQGLLVPMVQVGGQVCEGKGQSLGLCLHSPCPWCGKGGWQRVWDKKKGA